MITCINCTGSLFSKTSDFQDPVYSAPTQDTTQWFHQLLKLVQFWKVGYNFQIELVSLGIIMEMSFLLSCFQETYPQTAPIWFCDDDNVVATAAVEKLSNMPAEKNNVSYSCAGSDTEKYYFDRIQLRMFSVTGRLVCCQSVVGYLVRIIQQKYELFN